MKEYKWEEAMDWWKGSGDFQPMIRTAAVTCVLKKEPKLIWLHSCWM